MSGKYLAISVFLLLNLNLYSQTQKRDSTGTSENSAIFLNAASDSKPREVSLGLPTNSTSAVQIFEDGLPVSYYIYHLYPYKSWHGGSSAQKTGTMGPLESALRYGEINNYVDSYNRVGSDSFRGNFSYTLGSYGQNKLDMNVSGPIAGGWKYSASAFLNLDPGSNHIAYPFLKERHQFYKGAISKDFASGRGSMSLVYQYVHYLSLTENFGPFVFVGDGSVVPYEGFNLGVDSYRPEDKDVTYMDFMTGEMVTMDLKDGNRDRSHHLTYKLDYAFDSGMNLVFRSRFKNGDSVRGGGSMAAIDEASESSGYTYADGKSYVGLVQKRTLIHFDAFETSWMNNVELSWATGNHSLRAGADLHMNHGGTTTSSAIMAHEIKANPQMLYMKGERFYNFNTAGEYYDGFENKVAVYLKDGWKAGSRLDIDAFLRIEGLKMHGKSANNIGDDKSNTRYSGFNMTKGKVTTFSPSMFLNGAAGAELIYRLVGGLYLQTDGTFTRSHGNIFNYGGFYDPAMDPTDTYLLRFGFSYKNDWVNVLSQLNYISQSNYSTRSVFQHALNTSVGGFPAGYTESVTLPLVYGISSLGWMTDAMINPMPGLNFHVQFTLRDPQYKDFVFSPTFSDGVTEHYDFSGRNVTNLHKVEFVFDPSYSYGAWRWWLSTRYISKQYINKTNSLYFKGRVETFGGMDYRMNQNTKFSLNVINILNQKGASGLISSADLVEDASGYKNYVMAGTFIRPFTVEASVSIDF